MTVSVSLTPAVTHDSSYKGPSLSSLFPSLPPSLPLTAPPPSSDINTPHFYRRISKKGERTDDAHLSVIDVERDKAVIYHFSDTSTQLTHRYALTKQMGIPAMEWWQNQR